MLISPRDHGDNTLMRLLKRWEGGGGRGGGGGEGEWGGRGGGREGERTR